MSSSKQLNDIYQSMKEVDMKLPVEVESFFLPNAKEIFENAFKYFLSFQNKTYSHLPEYNEIISWLELSQSKGLFMYGHCGRGKTMIGRYVIPGIFMKYHRKIITSYDVGELDTKIDEALKLHFLSIDDIGTETMSVNFGKKRMPFAEIMDSAEKYGKTIILTSNLNGDDLVKRYGDRVMERIKATCKRVLFSGDSLRY